MTLDWPTVVLVLGVLTALCIALKLTLPYVVGVSSERARKAALDDITKRLNAVEGHLASGRRMPGRLG